MEENTVNITSSSADQEENNLIEMVSIACQVSVRTDRKDTVKTVVQLRKKRQFSNYVSKLIEEDIKRRCGELPKDTAYLANQYNILLQENEQFKSQMSKLTQLLASTTKKVTELQSKVSVVDSSELQSPIDHKVPVQVIDNSNLAAQTKFTSPVDKSEMKSFFSET